MIRPLTCLCFLLACGSGLYLYQTKHDTQLLDRTIAKTAHDTEALRAQTRVLQAEWTLLNDPDRLQPLVNQYLALKPMQPSQFTSMADLDQRLPPPRPPEPEAPPPAVATATPTVATTPTGTPIEASSTDATPTDTPSMDPQLPTATGAAAVDGVATTVAAPTVPLPSDAAPAGVAEGPMPLPPPPPPPLVARTVEPRTQVAPHPVKVTAETSADRPPLQADLRADTSRARDNKAATPRPIDLRPGAPLAPRLADTRPAQEQHLADTRPPEARSPDTHPADTHSADTRPVETRPAETRPAETRPAETRPTETRLAVAHPPQLPPQLPLRPAALPTYVPPAQQQPYTGSLLGMAHSNLPAPMPMPVPRPTPVNASQWTNGN